MEFVLLNDFAADGLKRPESNVESDVRGLDVAPAEFFEYFRGEMETRSRGGDGPGMLGEDGLVLAAILGSIVAMDVRRQRNVSEALQPSQEIGDIFEANGAFAEFAVFDDFGLQFVRSAFAEIKMFADADLRPGRTRHSQVGGLEARCL